jgi:signal transduction histidine kinase
LGQAFDGVSWHIDSAAARQVQSIPSLTAEVIFYAAREVIRNAAHHGRGDQAERRLCLIIALSWNNGLVLKIEDDGVGLAGADAPAIKGSGQGLALHSTMMAVVGGTITVESVAGKYTRVQLALPQEN